MKRFFEVRAVFCVDEVISSSNIKARLNREFSRDIDTIKVEQVSIEEVDLLDTLDPDHPDRLTEYHNKLREYYKKQNETNIFIGSTMEDTRIFCPICRQPPVREHTDEFTYDAETNFWCENNHHFYWHPFAWNSIFWKDQQTGLTHELKLEEQK